MVKGGGGVTISGNVQQIIGIDTYCYGFVGVVFCQILDLMTLEFFSNLNNSMML